MTARTSSTFAADRADHHAIILCDDAPRDAPPHAARPRIRAFLAASPRQMEYKLRRAGIRAPNTLPTRRAMIAPAALSA